MAKIHTPIISFIPLPLNASKCKPNKCKPKLHEILLIALWLLPYERTLQPNHLQFLLSISAQSLCIDRNQTLRWFYCIYTRYTGNVYGHHKKREVMESFLRAQHIDCYSLEHNPTTSLFELTDYQLNAIYSGNLHSAVFMVNLVSSCVLAMRPQLFVAILGIFFAREFCFSDDLIGSLHSELTARLTISGHILLELSLSRQSVLYYPPCAILFRNTVQ